MLRFIPKKIKILIAKIVCNLDYYIYFLYCKIKKQSLYILFGTPIHGNLGDHAIAYVEHKLFEGKKIKIFEVPSYLYNYYSGITNKLPNDTLIMISGGGSIGSQWIEEEKLMHEIVKKFYNKKIIIFPQTVYYLEDDIGINTMKEAKLIYNDHKNLHIYAREQVSYDKLKELFNAFIEFLPDVVLGMNEKDFLADKQFQRKGALLCLRNDPEKLITEEDRKNIELVLKDKFGIVNYTDTVIEKIIHKFNRKKFLKNKLIEFKKAELVITDRLHGMIFAAITGTPCICLNNYNHKVSGVYEIIKDLKYIKHINDIHDLKKEIEFVNANSGEYDYKKYYNMLLKIVE